MAAPLANLRKIFAEMDYAGLYKHLDAQAMESEFAASEGKKALHNFDALLMTLSYQTKDKDFMDMAESALASKVGAEMLLSETLHSLKQGRFESCALESFKYKLIFTPSKAGAVITARTTWLKEFTYDNLLEVDLTKNAGSFLLYAHKPELDIPAELDKSMREWQF